MSAEQEKTEYYNYLLWIEQVEFEQELLEIVSWTFKMLALHSMKFSL